MSKPSLRIRALRVERFYGIAHDGLGADDLCGGLNVVFGSNGQGKTTLGRALHALLWPAEAAAYRPALHGHLSLGEDDWRVEVEAGAARYQRGGLEAPPPPLPEPEHRPRYVLSLHELLGSDGRSFAEIIRRDAAGGMDVAAAAEALGFTAGALRAGKATHKASAAWEALEKVRRAQRELEQRAAGLERLQRQLADATRAQEEAALYERAREHAEARDEAQQAQRDLEALPAVLAKVREDDAEALEALRARLREAEARGAEAERKAAEAQARLERNLVVRAGRPEVSLTELEGHLSDMRTEEAGLARENERIAQQRAAEAGAWHAIKGALDEERAAEANVQALRGLDGYAQIVLRLQAEETARKALARAVKMLAAPEGAHADRERLEQGVRDLREWLSAPAEDLAADPTLRRLVLAGAAAAVVLGLALGLAWHPAALVLLAAALLLGFVAARLPAGRAEGRAEIERRFGRLDLGAPAWRREAVEAQLGEMERALATLRAAEAARQQAEAARPEAKEMAKLRSQREALRARTAEELGIDLGADPREPFIAIPYAIETLLRWQEARRGRLATEAVRAEIVHRIERRLARVQGVLAPFGLEPVQESAALAARIAALREALADCAGAERDRAEAEKDVHRAQEDAAEARLGIARLFERLGLAEAEGDEAVRAACAARAGYEELRETAARARTRAEQALERLQAHPGFREGLAALSRQEAEEKQAGAAERAAERDRLTKEITRLEGQVHHAREGRKLEGAAAHHRAALDALEEEREEAAARRVGQLLADRLAELAREQQLPPVVARARDLFAAITRHRYQLTFDAAADAFGAVDTVRQRGFRLEELSSGTRLQLLLSVRVAFVEQQEPGARLPLVLDEVLANSDDERARAIAEAVLHLCREGRQVFYFTAQADEVAKWRTLLEEHEDVERRFVALGGAGASELDLEALPAPALGEAVAPPAGRSHAEYGAALGVAAWDGWRPVEELDLWYVLDAPEALHAVRSLGFARLGPLLWAARSGKAEVLGLEGAVVARARVLAEALAAWQEAWRIGRGRRVDRAALEACPAISEVFLERVAEYGARVGGDARALLEGLRRGEVRRFRARQADELEAYLQEHGYLDEADRLSEDDIWARVLARVGPSCTADGAATLADVRAFLGRLAAGPPRRARQDSNLRPAD